MHALRGGDVVGDHTVVYASAGERVELNTQGFQPRNFRKRGASRGEMGYSTSPQAFMTCKTFLD